MKKCERCLFLNYDIPNRRREDVNYYFCGVHGRNRVPDLNGLVVSRGGGDGESSNCNFYPVHQAIEQTLFNIDEI